MDANARLLTRLQSDPAHDGCVLRLEEGDYGCEESLGPKMVWLLALTADGLRLSREIPEALAVELHLQEGAFFRLADAGLSRETPPPKERQP